MALRTEHPTDAHDPVGGQPAEETAGWRADLVAAGVAAALVVAAIGAIVWLHWYSFGKIFAWAPPLFGHWLPRLGPGTPTAVALAVAVVLRGPELAARLRWRWLAPVGYGAAVVWTVSLALINGWQRGMVGQFTSSDQYLLDVPKVTDIGGMLRGFTTHILTGDPGSWVTQVSGHPPGSFLVFLALDRLGLRGGGWAAVGCLAVGCLAAVAVPLTVRALGDDRAARAVAPFAVLLPGAVFLGVSADGLFAGVTSVAVLCVATGARRLGPGVLRSRAALGGAALCVAGGLLLGYGMFLSYGLVLLAPIALAACLVARSWRAPLIAAGSALAVVGVFTAAGFWWLDGYNLVIQRYYQDLGRSRPFNYWVWADLAAFVLSAGPVVAPGLRRAVLAAVRARSGWFAGIRPVAALAVGAALAIAVADKSGLSKAEVERIWLPFGVWLVASAALLPARHRRWWLAGQALTGLAVGHLVLTSW